MLLDNNYKLTLEERVFIGCEQGLYRTYAESYDHECLDMFHVPRTIGQCDPDDIRAYLKYHEILSQKENPAK